MILQLCIVCIVIFFSPLVPPILSPLGFSLTGVVLVQQANPRVLSLLTVGISTIATICIRVIQNYIIAQLNVYDKKKSNNFFLHTISRMDRYIKNQDRITEVSTKREEYIKTKTGRFATFLFAVFCFLPTIPDIISTRILYKKISFPSFVLAVIIGKSLTFIPFIFIGKSILQLLHIGI